MSFFLINAIVLVSLGLFIYVFVESKKVKLFEMLSAALYCPFFTYFLLKEKKLLEADIVPAAILGVVMFEFIAIITIYKKIQDLKNN